MTAEALVPTPRTDAFSSREDNEMAYYACLDFARTLEREIAELQQQLEETAKKLAQADVDWSALASDYRRLKGMEIDCQGEIPCKEWCGKSVCQAFINVAELQRQLAEVVAEVREWACEKCNYVYPGPPQKGFMCVICPRCEGTTVPHETLKRRQAERQLAEAQTLCIERGDALIKANNDVFLLREQLAERDARPITEKAREMQQACYNFLPRDIELSLATIALQKAIDIYLQAHVVAAERPRSGGKGAV